jgi:hypothetical protein
MKTALPLRVVLIGSFLTAGLLGQPAQPATPPPPYDPNAPLTARDFPAASPASTLQQRVGATDIEIKYYRPGAKGRVMIGTIEPFGKVWRTGANNATTISFSTAVKLGGQAVTPGKYALFTIPGESKWTVILNKNPNQWGAFTYDPSGDAIHFDVTPVRLTTPVETFEIGINDLRDDSATINLTWETWRVPVKLETNLVSEMVAKIDASMAAPSGRKFYAQAAGFYLDHNLDLKKALEWANAAVAAGENQTSVHLTAKILAKMGDKEGAIAAAKHSIELAEKSNNVGIQTEYRKLNENLIASLR